MGKSLPFSAAVATAMAFASTSANAVTISQPVNSYNQPNLCGATTGGCQTVYWGETFTAPMAGQLTNLQFTLGPSSSLASVYAAVFAWNGSAITGSALWTSANVAGAPGVLNFDPTGVDLASGQMYVALLGTYGIGGNSGAAQIGSCNAFTTCPGTVADPYLGYAVYANLQNGTVNWHKTTNNYADLTFSATIEAAVPEASTWVMMIAGFAVVGAGMRRRHAAVRFA